MIRLFEFSDAQSQIDLWKLISDSVWQGIRLQAIEQEQNRSKVQKKLPKTKLAKKSIKKPKTVSPKAPAKPSKNKLPGDQKKSVKP